MEVRLLNCPCLPTLSQVLVERFGLAARFGFMHLAATNLALWIRLVVWESGNEWTYFVYLAQSDGYSFNYDGRADHVPTPLQLRGFPRSVTDSMAQAVQAALSAAPRARRDLGLGEDALAHDGLPTCRAACGRRAPGAWRLATF